MGGDTKASGNRAVAIGIGTTANGAEAFAMGDGTEASGSRAAALGNKTMASNRSAVSMGENSQASGIASIAMGTSTTASGRNAVAMGKGTSADAKMAVAMGNETEVSGWHSVAMNGNTTAQAKNSLVIGRWNTISGSESQWNPDDPLFVAGNGNGDTDRSNALLLKKNGEMTIAGNLTENSDRRLKTNIQKLGSVLGDLEDIAPVRFHFKEDTGHPEDRQIGLIAQEVQDAFPELVTKGSDGYLSLAYPKLTAVLLKGLQEQQATIEDLKAKNKTLSSKQEVTQNRLDSLEDRLARLESRVGAERPASAGLLHSWALGGLFLAFLAGGVVGTRLRSLSAEK